MNSLLKIFIRKILIFSLVLTIIAAIFYLTVLKPYYLHILPVVQIFFIVVNIGVHAWFTKIYINKQAKVINAVMIATIAKIFIYVIIITGYLLLYKENALQFIIPFILLYILYTSLEIISIYNTLKSNNTVADKIK